MNAILHALQNRTSYPARQLSDPGPDDAQLEEILLCGVSAPDHAALHPWRFIIIKGSARRALAEIFAQAALKQNPELSEQKLQAIKDKALRSPIMLVIVATIIKDHPKTPEIEQILSAGAAATHIQLGANALGFGSVWVTGSNAYDTYVKQALGIDPKDHIVGFLHIGTKTIEMPPRTRPKLSDCAFDWPGAEMNDQVVSKE